MREEMMRLVSKRWQWTKRREPKVKSCSAIDRWKRHHIWRLYYYADWDD
jgi:hypothetical protein